MTISAVGLRRPELEEERVKYFVKLRLLKQALRRRSISASLKRDIAAEFARAVRDDAEYAAMARAALPEHWPPPA